MALGQLAQAAAPYILDAMGNIIQNATEPKLSTEQTDQALRYNDDWAAGRSRDQLAIENAAYNERADSNDRRVALAQGRTAGYGNAASNANAARMMAANAQSALNSQYLTAGERLNNASRDASAASNDAMRTIASLFGSR
jgi:hypothetical protein